MQYFNSMLMSLTGCFIKNPQVHRIVMNICTEYFAALEKTAEDESGVLILPEELDHQTTITIIK